MGSKTPRTCCDSAHFNKNQRGAPKRRSLLWPSTGIPGSIRKSTIPRALGKIVEMRNLCVGTAPCQSPPKNGFRLGFAAGPTSRWVMDPLCFGPRIVSIFGGR